MIVGLGNDIIEIDRIEKLIDQYGKRFLDRHFTPHEQAYCLRYKDAGARFAGRFAAKEAIAKALGTGIRGAVSWLAMEIRGDDAGKPEVLLSSEIQQAFNDPHILISISHCKSYATAVAIRVDVRGV